MPRLANTDVPESSPRLAEGTVSVAAILLAVGAVLVSMNTLWDSADALLAGSLPWLLICSAAFAVIATILALSRVSQVQCELRDVRLESQGLTKLLDAWLWRSDAQHCLTLMRPPTAAGVGAWAEAVTGQVLWEYYGADPTATAELRARVEARVLLDGLRVWRCSTKGTRELIELRGDVCNDAQGCFVGYLGSARVLSDEETLRTDHYLLEALLIALPVPVFILVGDSNDSSIRVLRANSAAADLTRQKLSQLNGLALADVSARMPTDVGVAMWQVLKVADDDSEHVLCGAWALYARRNDMSDQPSERHKTGGHVWVLTLVPVTSLNNAPNAVAADHESFGYSVSHDLRAPLRVVDGFAKILKEDYGHQLDRVGNDHLDRVLGAVVRMNSMIDALLALSQLSVRPLACQSVDLSQLATYISEDLRRQSPGREAILHVEPGLQTYGDPTLLRVVLENLLGNAWKYSARKHDAQVWLECDSHGGCKVFTVRDNGAGFDMRFADRLFGAFQRLHSASDFPGTGVGLATVRRIIRRHGGEIWAESEVDRGSSFHFTLPSGSAV